MFRAAAPDLAAALDRLDTFEVRTPSGGEHYHLTADEGAYRQGPFPGGDLKVGGKGYVLLPPSPGYARVSGDLDALAAAPPDLAAFLDEQPRQYRGAATARRGAVKLTRFTSHEPTVPVQDTKLPPRTPRHPILFGEACAMRGRGWGHAEILAAIRAMNQRLFEEPKADHLIDALAADVCERFPAGERPEPSASPPADDALRRELSEARARAALAESRLEQAEQDAHAVASDDRVRLSTDREEDVVKGAAHLGYRLGHEGSTLLLKPRGERWQIIRKGSPWIEKLLNAMRRGCVDERGDPWILPHRFEFRLLAAACMLETIHASDAYAWRVDAVTHWANEQMRGYFSYGDVAHLSGIVDKHRGRENLGPEAYAIVDAGLDVADEGWVYRDRRLPGGSHSRRWHCPRQTPLALREMGVRASV